MLIVDKEFLAKLHAADEVDPAVITQDFTPPREWMSDKATTFLIKLKQQTQGQPPA